MAPHNHPFPFMKDHPSSSSSSLGQNNTTTSKGKEKETPYDAFPSSSYQVEPLEHSKIEHNLSNPPWSQIQMNSTMQEQETPYYAFPSSSYQVEPLDHTKVDHNSSNLPQGQIQMNSNEKKMLTNRVVSGQNQNHTMQVQGNPSVFYYAFLANNYGVGPLASPPQSQNQMNSRAVSESLGQNENHTRPEQETTNYARLPSNNNMVNQYMQSYSEVEWLRDPLEGLSLSNPNPMPMRRVNSELNTLTIRPNRFLYSPPIGNNGTLGFGQQYSPPNVENYRGQLVSMAKHLDGCRLLQNMIDRGNPIELDTIFLELKDHLYDLMMHPLGTKVIQKFLQPNRLFTRHVHCILDLITEDAHQLKHVCTNNHGTLAIQQMLLHIGNPEHMITITHVMRRITVPLMKNTNGGYVMMQYLSLFPPICQKVIMDEVSRNCKEILTDKYGCSVLQRWMPLVQTEAMNMLHLRIVEHALDLAEDRYGNYALQYVIKMKIPEPQINNLITSRLRGSYVQLSMNKHASNVVEDLLRYSEIQTVLIIVREIMNSPNFLNVLQDQFGNYVVQCALECSKEYILYEVLCHEILSKKENLQSHLYGKRVLTSIKGYKIRI